MIWLIGFSVCLLLLSGDLGVASPEPDALWTFSLVMLATVISPCFACIQSKLVSKRWRNIRERHLVVNGILRRMLVSNYLVWLGSSATIMIILDWPTLVRDSWSLGRIPLIDDIVIAIPMIASIIISGVVINSSLHKSGKSTSTVLPTNRSNFVLAVGQLRTFAGLVFVPVLTLFLLRDLFNLFLPQAYTGLALGLGGTLFFILLTCFYPVIVATTWKTGPLPRESLKTDLLQVAMDRGMRPIPVRVWYTHEMIVNAVVVGLVPGTRNVFLTDGLLEHFEDREVLAIFRHELGHVALGHLWIRLFVLISPLLTATLAFGCILEYRIISELPGGTSSMIATGLAALASMWWLVAVPVFRYCEFSADRFAIQDAHGNPNPQLAADYYSALLKMAMVNPDSWSGRSMVHPSIRSRAQAVAAYAGLETHARLETSGAIEN